MRMFLLATLLALAGCSSTPSLFVEAGAGYMREARSDAGPRDIQHVENPRGVLAAGVMVPLTDRVELSATIRHDSGALVYDYGQTGVYAAVRWYLFKR